MSTVANPITTAADELHTSLAEIRGRVDTITQIIHAEGRAPLQSRTAQHQLELANHCLAQVQSALLDLAGSMPEDDEADVLNWEFHISQPPVRRAGTVSVSVSRAAVPTVPSAVDPLTD